MNNSRFWRRDVVFCRFRRPSPMFVTYFQTKHVHSEISHIKRIILQYFHMAYIIDTIAIFICFPRLGRSTARERPFDFQTVHRSLLNIHRVFSFGNINGNTINNGRSDTGMNWNAPVGLFCFIWSATLPRTCNLQLISISRQQMGHDLHARHFKKKKNAETL